MLCALSPRKAIAVCIAMYPKIPEIKIKSHEVRLLFWRLLWHVLCALSPRKAIAVCIA